MFYSVQEKKKNGGSDAGTKKTCLIPLKKFTVTREKEKAGNGHSAYIPGNLPGH